MAISNLPQSTGNNDYSKVVYVPAGTLAPKVVFSGLRKGIYKGIGVAAYFSTTSSQGFSPVQLSYSDINNIGFSAGWMQDSSGQSLQINGGIGIDRTWQVEGYFDQDNTQGIQNIMVPVDGASIVIPLITYREVTTSHAMMAGSFYYNQFPLIIGNTMLTFIRNRTRASQAVGTDVFLFAYRFGTNTTTFSTSIPSPTFFNVASGSGFSYGWIGNIIYESSETNKWVVVGAYAGSGIWADSRPLVRTSTDAVTWTSQTLGGTFYNNAANDYTGLHNIVYYSGSYYASGVVLATTTPSLTYNSRIWTSTDANTWTQAYSTSSIGYTQLYDLSVNPSAAAYLAFYNSNDGYIHYSANLGSGSNPLTSIVISSYYFLSAVNGKFWLWYRDANEEIQLASSTDALTWTLNTINFVYGTNFGPMQYDAGYYWAAENTGIVISTNGTVFDYYSAQGYQDASNGDSRNNYPTGFKPAHDGTRYGWVRTPTPMDTSIPESAKLYYTTGTTAEYLYGRSHPDIDYMLALPDRSGYPTTL